MAVLINGIAVNFGVGMTLAGTGVGAANTTTGLFQNFDHSKKRKSAMIGDDNGATVTDILFDPSEEATVTYFVRAISGTNTLAGAIGETTIPDIGTFITITVCLQYPPLNKTTWRVADSTVKGTNSTAKEVTLKLIYHPGVAVGPAS